uniref:Uncharacterized protein n=1 Tax=Romanomermis culicivorax TaxID=13658 RepID=A0A915J0Y3_ROMCU
MVKNKRNKWSSTYRPSGQMTMRAFRWIGWHRARLSALGEKPPATSVTGSFLPPSRFRRQSTFLAKSLLPSCHFCHR